MKKHIGFIIFFILLIFLVFKNMIFVKTAFLGGDYGAQFYPWSQIYAENIKNFTFPYWTRYFHSGFPLMAEGQVGGFYPFNILFFFFLPFKIAYNYIVVFHFILAGVFAYMYARKLGACEWGGTLAALIFCFGSAYAGCFYNTVTVKTLIWVPVVLLLIENYFERKKIFYICIAGIIWGMQLLAGFIQVALYSALFYAAYYVYGLAIRKDLKIKYCIISLIGVLIGSIIAIPQLLLSLSLVELSGRSNATLGFALWGSFSPMNIMALVFPYSVFTGIRLYIGVFSLIFFFISMAAFKSKRNLRPLILLFGISIFLALGKYNPLYVLFLKLTHFYGFRNPSKFLFFGMFATSISTGCGFTLFFDKAYKKQARFGLKVSTIFIGSMLSLFLLAKVVLRFFGESILKMGQWYAENYIHGKPFHRYDLNVYMEKVQRFYNGLIENSSLLNPYVMASFVFCIFTLIILIYFLRKKNHYEYNSPVFKILFFTIIIWDLFVFSFYGTGFRGNIVDYKYLIPQKKSIFDIVKKDQSLFRILPVGIASDKLPNWCLPNLNAAYKIDSIAAYSPLSAGIYGEKLESLEIVDTSLGLMDPETSSIKNSLEIIRLLNVKYIISVKELNFSFLKNRGKEENIYLYEVQGFMPRVYLLDEETLKPLSGGVVVEEYSDGYCNSVVNFADDCLFVLSEFIYPGWSAFIDNEEVEIKEFNEILMSIYVKKGKHKIEFKYEPWKSDR